MEKKIVVIAFVLAAAVLVVVLLTQDGVNVGGSWVRDRSVAETKTVSSYRYNITVATDSEGFLGDVPVSVKSRMEGSGVIDLGGRFMYTPVSINVRGSSGGKPIMTETRMEMYVTGNTLYSKAGQRWVKQTLNEDMWGNTQLDRRNEVIGNAVVGFVESGEVYVVEFKPLLNVLADYAVEVSGSTPSLNAELNSETITNHRVMELISKESFLPLRTVIEFTTVSGNITTTMTINTEYYDYNKPVEAKLPEEIADAIEV